MSETCPKCGLVKEICICETIAKESQRIKVRLEKRKFGKVYTAIYGIDQKDIDLRQLAKKLKTEFACGGTVKEGRIDLQGNHVQKVKQTLIRLGFAADTIDIK